MTLHRRTAVTCDGTLVCRAVITEDGPDAIVEAARRGWVRVRRKGAVVDLCPAHKAPPT